jgi:hypothetical protein
MRHDQAMTRITIWIAWVAAAAAIAATLPVAPAGATTAAHWSKSHCALQQALFNVRHPKPTGLQVAGGNKVLQQHGCAQRVPGPSRWSNSQCEDYQATFLKLYASPSNKQIATANGALKKHGCHQRVEKLPQGY